MRLLIYLPAALYLGLCPAGTLMAQSLSLFEPVQQMDTQADLARRGPAPPTNPARAQESFALRSSVRFGRVYHVVLTDTTGRNLALEWQPGQRVEVPQHPGVTVLDVTGAELQLQLPSDRPCVTDENRGVRCPAPDTAVLSLATLSALAPQPGPEQSAEAEARNERDLVGVNPPSDTVFVNPFSAATQEVEALTPAQQQDRAERARARQQRLQQFQIERIPDDQVPPGMRRVRTPFGDRLVPSRE